MGTFGDAHLGGGHIDAEILRRAVRQSRDGDAIRRVFEQSLRMVSQVLDKGGNTAANVATAQSMFGLQMFVKLDNDHVISIGKSDIAKFRAAKRGNADTAE